MAVITIEGTSSLEKDISYSTNCDVNSSPNPLYPLQTPVFPRLRADYGPRRPLLIHQLVAFSAPFEIKRKGEISLENVMVIHNLQLLSCEGSELPSPKTL